MTSDRTHVNENPDTLEGSPDPFVMVPHHIMDALPPRELQTWLHLKRFSYHGNVVFPSLATLARNSHQSENTVRKSIKKLVSLGFLERIASKEGKQTTNRYRVIASDLCPSNIAPHREFSPSDIAFSPSTSAPLSPSTSEPEEEQLFLRIKTEEEPPFLPLGGKPKPTRQNWGKHLDLCKRAVKALQAKRKLPERCWQSIGSKRRNWILARMKQLGITSPEDFWIVIYQGFLRADTSNDWLTLDLVLDPRPRSTEHWDSFLEGRYEQPLGSFQSNNAKPPAAMPYHQEFQS